MRRTRLTPGIPLVIAMLAVMIVAGSCTTAQDPTDNGDDERPQDDLPELIIAIAREGEGLDPQQVTGVNYWLHGLIVTPPVSIGLDQTELLPYGAQEVDVSPDGMQLYLTFDPERMFHSGNPVTAEAYKQSVERYRETSPYAFDFDSVDEMDVDGNMMTMNLHAPGPGIVVVLASEYGAPVDVLKANEMGEADFNRQPYACGPYIVEEWVEDSHVVLVRNDDYFDYLPFVDNNGPFHFSKVTVRFIPDDFIRVSELRAGNVDIIQEVPAEHIQSLEDDPNVNVLSFLRDNTMFLAINHDSFPLDDESVRLAVALAIDRDEVAELLNHAIKPTYGIVSKGMLRHDPETEAYLRSEYAHNADRARQVLEEAGWEEGSDGVRVKDGQRLTFEFAYASDATFPQRSAPLFQAQLERVGFDVQMRGYDARYISQAIEEGSFDIALAGRSWLEPGGTWPAALRTGARMAAWSHPDVDALLDRVLVEPDEEEGARMWGEISRRIWADVALIPLWADYRYIAVRSEVTGLKMSVSGLIFLNDLTKE